jgi:predicted nuclease of predicted toxin-antitoxin system
MRFLADESCDFRVIRALRAAGHDVVAVAEVAAGTEDDAVIEMAIHEGRIFVTEDRDFGQLVYAAARRAQGVILLRFPSNARGHLPTIVVDLVAEHGDKLTERFVVVQPGRIRFGVVPKD